VSDDNNKEIGKLQKELQDMEIKLAEVEEQASDQFREWYQLQQDRNRTITKIRDLVRTTPFPGKAMDYGTFRITRSSTTTVDLHLLRTKAPEVLAIPGVVSKVDIKALKSAIASEDVPAHLVEVVEECLEVVDGSSRISGPKVTTLS
jgi:hypothetical protein